MSCDNDDGDGHEDGKDHGTLDELSWEGSLHEEIEGSYCEDPYMDWTVNAGVNASDTRSECYDEIQTGEANRWRFNLHFSDPPGNMVDGCDYEDPAYDAWPENFRYRVERSDEDSSELRITEEEPDNADSQSSNEEIYLLLDIVGSFGKYASIGAAIGKYWIRSQDGTNVDTDPGKIVWDVALDGDNGEVPREEDGEAKTVQTSALIENDYPPDEYGLVEFFPEYTFGYHKKDGHHSCRCNSYGGYYKTTVANETAFAGYRSVE